MARKKAASHPSKLTETEQDLLSHIQDPRRSMSDNALRVATVSHINNNAVMGPNGGSATNP
jgi:hypothetical protein